MLDRVGALAGFVADVTSRALTRVVPSRFSGLVARRHVGAIGLALVLIALAGRAVISAIPYAIADAVDLHSITPANNDRLATISGVLADQYIETFRDINNDRTQQPGETGIAWLYFVGTDDGATGVVVSSSRPPDEMYATADQVTLTGRFVISEPRGVFSLRSVPEFDATTLPFRVTDGAWFYEGADFVQIGQARDAVIVFGGLAALLLVGARLGYPVFRATTSAGGPPAASPTQAVPVRLSGPVNRDGRVVRVREASAILRMTTDPFGRRTFLVHDAAELSSPPLATLSREDAHEVVQGDAVGLGGRRWAFAVSRPAGRLVVAFDSVSDRDDFLGAVQSA